MKVVHDEMMDPDYQAVLRLYIRVAELQKSIAVDVFNASLQPEITELQFDFERGQAGSPFL